MMKPEKKRMSQRDKELFLGHLVTWGSIISGLVLAIAFAPVSAADKDPGAPTPRSEATLDIEASVKG
jgi:hypothetical protein